jgi:TRAP-type C4-dicarboxylate transport system permease small subunit
MELFGRFLRFLALLSGGVLLLLMFYTVTDVVLRYGFNHPLRGSIEFTEFCMSLIVFLAIAYTGWSGGHIVIDLFEKWLDRPALRYLPAIIAFIGATLFAAIAWRAAVETTFTINQISNMLRWPHYPFRYTVAFGSAMFALVMFIQGIQAIGKPPKEKLPDADL